jgi:hypothetical protein
MTANRCMRPPQRQDRVPNYDSGDNRRPQPNAKAALAGTTGPALLTTGSSACARERSSASNAEIEGRTHFLDPISEYS